MQEESIQINKEKTAKFRVSAPESRGLVEVEWTIQKATLFHPDYVPPKKLSVIATLEIRETTDQPPFFLGYLGLSEGPNDPAVSLESQKMIGPFIAYGKEILNAEPLYQHRFGDTLSGEGNVRVYPYGDTLLGLWAKLLSI